jgi:hypothetical protein
VRVAALGGLEDAVGELHPDSLHECLQAEDVDVREGAVWCAMARRFPIAHSTALHEVQLRTSAASVLALPLALCGSARDAERMFEVAAENPEPRVYEALGWMGDIRIVPFLLGRLAHGDAAAIIALQRLTGASILGTDLPTYDKGALPFSPGAAYPEPFLLLSDDAEMWRAWWERYGHAAAAGTRYRFGRPWSADVNLWEMELAHVGPRTRRLAFLELVARFGVIPPFDPTDLVSRQRKQLAQCREFLQLNRSSSLQGQWPSRLAS